VELYRIHRPICGIPSTLFPFPCLDSLLKPLFGRARPNTPKSGPATPCTPVFDFSLEGSFFPELELRREQRGSLAPCFKRTQKEVCRRTRRANSCLPPSVVLFGLVVSFAAGPARRPDLLRAPTPPLSQKAPRCRMSTPGNPPPPSVFI